MNTENNKIIAEFMGLSYCEKYQFEGWYKNHEHNERVYELNYDFDWNWLMEVVEKIKTVGYLAHFDLQFIGCEISVIDIDGNTIFSTYPKRNTAECKMIDCTYKAVVNFIEWCNEQNKN